MSISINNHTFIEVMDTIKGERALIFAFNILQGVSSEQLIQVLVLGLDTAGFAVANYAKKLGFDIRIFEKKKCSFAMMKKIEDIGAILIGIYFYYIYFQKL